MGGIGFHGFSAPAAPTYRPPLPMMSRREAALEKFDEDTSVHNHFVNLRGTIARCLDLQDHLRGADANNCRFLALLIHSDFGPELRGASRHASSDYWERERAQRIKKFMRSRNIDMRCLLSDCKSFKLWQPDQHASSEVKLRLFERRLWELAIAMRRKKYAMVSENFDAELRVLEEFCTIMVDLYRQPTIH